MSKSLIGAAIMSAGTANGNEFSVRDLYGIATSFDALGLAGRIPLKFGHNEEQPLTDGQPALGWVSRLYVDGDTLYADFTDMPTVVYDLVRAGSYKFISVELLKNVPAGTRTLPWVLDAVALLGADQPAFGMLKDLQALTLKRGPRLRSSARVAFRRDTKLFSTGGPKAMTEDEVKALMKKQAEELTEKFTASIAKVTADGKAEADKRIAEVQATAAKDKAESHRTQIKAKFETAVKAETLLPAKRESFYKFNRIDDDASVIQIKLEDVDAYITEYSDKTKLSRKQQTQQGGADEAHATTYAGEVSRLAVKLAVERGEKADDYQALKAATRLVLTSNPKLAKAYIADPSGAFNPQEAA